MKITWKGPAFILMLVFGTALPALAHRTDEYLQATKLTVGREDVLIEMSLTPGMDVAPLVFSWIDRDRDGHISGREGEVYAGQIVQFLALQVDAASVPVVLSGQSFPDFASMREGIGTIHLLATARLPRLAQGAHRIIYTNGYEPNWSVYLSNPLVPRDPGVEILSQSRDRLQRQLALEYQLSSHPTTSPDRALGLGALLTLISCGALWVRMRNRKYLASPGRHGLTSPCADATLRG